MGKEASNLPRRILCVFWEEEEEECVRENLVLMCEKGGSWKKCVQTKNMEKSCV